MEPYKQAGSKFFWVEFTVGGERFRKSTGKTTMREAVERAWSCVRRSTRRTRRASAVQRDGA